MSASLRHGPHLVRLLLCALLAIGLLWAGASTVSASASVGSSRASAPASSLAVDSAAATSATLTPRGLADPMAQLALQQAEFIAPDGVTGDNFGDAVAISGDTALVGAPWHGNGAAYVFTGSGSSWTEQAELTAPDGSTYDLFGAAVALSGDVAVIGAPDHKVGANGRQGAAYVFSGSGSTWTEQAELTASDGTTGDYFGTSVALSGDAALVGAPWHAAGGNPNQGAAYLFADLGSGWSQEAELTASDGTTGDYFGTSVALSGETALVGAMNHAVASNAGQGAAYLFGDSGAGWSQEAELASSDGGPADHFGLSVALSGETALIGAPYHQVGDNASQGAAYLFSDPGSGCSQEAELTASDGGANDQFGTSVALSGGSALVGALDHQVGDNASQGAAYLFSDSGWGESQQAELTSSDGGANDQFGTSVALSGESALVGAYDHVVDGKARQGAAYEELAAVPPAGLVAPLVSGSTAPDDTLSSSSGTWSGDPAPSYAYQWLRDGSPIGGATAASYTIAAGDCEHTISCQVTATNDAGSTIGISNGLSIPAVPPANTTAPVVSGGTALGDTLSCADGTWTGDPTPTLTYQWLREGVAISDASNDSYVITADDQGHLLSCQVTATNDGGTLAETSNLVAVPAVLGAPTSTQDPVVGGNAFLGQVLSCSSGAWTGSVASLTYQWQRGGVAIAGATSSTYRLARADCAASLSCVVTAANSAGQTSVVSNSLTASPAPAIGLRVSPHALTAGGLVTISGTVRDSLASSRTVCLCRRLHHRLIVLRRLKLSGSGSFRCTWTAHRGGLWHFVASYTAAGYRFTSKAVSVTVRKR